MANIEPLGLRRLEAIHYIVHDLERSRRFYTEKMDFRETAASDPEREPTRGARTAVFEANDVRVIVSQPVGEAGEAARWLKVHPDGVAELVFEVEDIERTFRLLDGRGGTPVADVARTSAGGGTFSTFAMTTPFGSARFRFVERKGTDVISPALVRHDAPRGGDNAFRFGHIDHITSNFMTMSPALLWMEHVLGFERYWDIEFHTNDVAAQSEHGSGLRSVVMWDPHSEAKFANNEPMRPNFHLSQIHLFCEDQRGDGIQHAALTVEDIEATVRGMRARDVRFMPTPGAYYDMLPERLGRIGVGTIDEDHGMLRDLEILVDGSAERSYLLQIFMQESAGLYNEPEAGPFFYEIIHRKGDRGFGGGNFRALFESIERQQRQEGRV